jgi:hypothetical protein
MSDLIYIVATRRREGLPKMAKACDDRIYYTYADAEAARQAFSADIKDSFGVFSVHAIIQQEVTFEVPF